MKSQREVLSNSGTVGDEFIGYPETPCRYPDFYDAHLEAWFIIRTDIGPVVSFSFTPFGNDSFEIPNIQYQVGLPDDFDALAVDLRRLDFNLPFSVGDLPKIISQLDEQSLLVELVVRESWSGQEVVLVKRHRE